MSRGANMWHALRMQSAPKSAVRARAADLTTASQASAPGFAFQSGHCKVPVGGATGNVAIIVKLAEEMRRFFERYLSTATRARAQLLGRYAMRGDMLQRNSRRGAGDASSPSHGARTVRLFPVIRYPLQLTYSPQALLPRGPSGTQG